MDFNGLPVFFRMFLYFYGFSTFSYIVKICISGPPRGRGASGAPVWGRLWNVFGTFLECFRTDFEKSQF